MPLRADRGLLHAMRAADKVFAKNLELVQPRRARGGQAPGAGLPRPDVPRRDRLGALRLRAKGGLETMTSMANARNVDVVDLLCAAPQPAAVTPVAE